MLYPQNGDRIVAVDTVTSVHAMYRPSVTAGCETRPTLAILLATLNTRISKTFAGRQIVTKRVKGKPHQSGLEHRNEKSDTQQ